MESKSWSIVEFLEDGAVIAVPSTWIKGNVCYWPPPLSRIQLVNALKQLEPLDTSWRTYDVQVFKNATFDNYSEAWSKAKEVEETSDQQSKIEGIRKRKQKFIYSSSSDEESVSPLKLKERRMTDEGKNSDETVAGNSSTDHFNIKKEDTNVCKNCIKKDEYLQTIIEQNHLIRELLENVLKKLENNSTSMKEKPSTKRQSLLTKYPELKFPINSEEDLVILENILRTEEDFENGVQELSNIGGDNNYQFVKRILSTLITNNLALLYSWLGRKGKKEFCKLKIAELVICAAEKANIAKNRRQTEVSIQQWLKRASDRNSFKSVIKTC